MLAEPSPKQSHSVATSKVLDHVRPWRATKSPGPSIHNDHSMETAPPVAYTKVKAVSVSTTTTGSATRHLSSKQAAAYKFEPVALPGSPGAAVASGLLVNPKFQPDGVPFYKEPTRITVCNIKQSSLFVNIF